MENDSFWEACFDLATNQKYMVSGPNMLFHARTFEEQGVKFVTQNRLKLSPETAKLKALKIRNIWGETIWVAHPIFDPFSFKIDLRIYDQGLSTEKRSGKLYVKSPVKGEPKKLISDMYQHLNLTLDEGLGMITEYRRIHRYAG